ncbi:MAG: pilus assembly protein TadG-related protein [Candidatus Dormibacteraeota bacterium]|nr:pilus assembly protein TadG-related protein [Candidatus Dormibacteraeota bacterium]
MHRRTGARRGQRGQVVVIVALMAMLLFGLGALALDVSLAMSDRRMLQANVDSAALAGAVSYATSTNAAHYVAFQYLQKPLNFTLPLGSCTAITVCPAGTYTTGTYTITIGDPASKQMDLSIQHTEPGILASLIGSTIQTGNSVRSMAPGPTLIAPSYGAVAVSGEMGNNGGGATVREFGASVYAATDFGANNGTHAYMMHATQIDQNGTQCNPTVTNHLDHGGTTNAEQWTWVGPPTGGVGIERWSQPAPTPFDTVSPRVPAGTVPFQSAGFPANAQDGSGNWKPGIYDGVYPSAPGKLNPGVYKLINNAGAMTFGALTNVTAAPGGPGTEDAAGAIVIVLDSSDTGTIDISKVSLNGIDDLHPQSYVGPRDPQGTHNFVFYGGNGASGYTGSINFAPGTNFSISGVFYMPKLTMTSNGNPTMSFLGQVTVASFHISGGGAATQTIAWVCGINVVLGNPAIQGGINR